MGDKKRMDSKDNNSIILYSSQTNDVFRIIKTEGIYFAKFKFIKEKYGEVSDVFLNAYGWYNENADKIVKKPKEAESGIWAFKDVHFLELNDNSTILKLKVPLDEVIFFRMSDWNKVLNLRYIGLDEEEEKIYEKKLINMGIKYEGDVFLTPYYPLLKRDLIKSFNNLFRFNESIKEGKLNTIPDIQAGLWQIKKDWIVDF